MEVSKATNFVIDWFETNEMVNTVTVRPQTEIDFEKSNIYPLVNVDLTVLNPIGAVHRLTYSISVFQQRDIKPTINIDNKQLNTNMIDNLNETYSIASKFINWIRSFHNDADIDVFEVTDVIPSKNAFTNGLDGVTFSITLEVPDTSNC